MSISMKNSDLIPIVKDKGLNNKLIHDHIYTHISLTSWVLITI